MRSNPMLVVLSLFLWLPMSLSPAVAQSTSRQPAKNSAAAESAPLTPQEKEAQKHYRVALEAIKNNDFSTAADELKAASELAPKNALIWYNLAVVESKKGDSAPALQHLQKAESLGLPKSLQNDADQLEAKLSYEVEKGAKREADELKREQLSKQIHTLLDGLGGSFDCKRGTNTMSWYASMYNNGSCEVTVERGSSINRVIVTSPGNGSADTQDDTLKIQLNLADASPDVSVSPETFFRCHDDDYQIVIKGKTKVFPATMTHRESYQVWDQGVQQPASITGGDPLNTTGLPELYFRGSDVAKQPARRISDAIRLCTGEAQATPTVNENSRLPAAADFVGTWTGTMQSPAGNTFPVTIQLNDFAPGGWCGVLHHPPPLDADGKLKCVKIEHSLTVSQTITWGRKRCLDGLNVLTLVDNGTMERVWIDPATGVGLDRGLLKRQKE